MSTIVFIYCRQSGSPFQMALLRTSDSWVAFSLQKIGYLVSILKPFKPFKMRFIKLTYNHNGNTVYVNSHLIMTISKHTNHSGTSITLCGVSRGDSGLEVMAFQVNESPDQIIFLIKELK